MTCTQTKVDRLAKKIVKVWLTGSTKNWQSIDEKKTVPALLKNQTKENLFRFDMQLAMISDGCGKKNWPSNWRKLTLAKLVDTIG
jgi:hypothetical protein